jgi:hypothetical protein
VKVQARSAGWLLIGAGSIGAMVTELEAVSLPFLTGSGLAQADFELFAVSVLIGAPAAALSIGGLLVLRRHREPGSSRSYRATAITAVNTLVVLTCGLFALAIRSFGFFWK